MQNKWLSIADYLTERFIGPSAWSGLDFDVWIEQWDDMSQVRIGSAHLDELDNPLQAYSRWAALKALFHGAMFLEYGPMYQLHNLGTAKNQLTGEYASAQFAPDPLEFPFAEKVLARGATVNFRGELQAGERFIALSRHRPEFRWSLQNLGDTGLTAVNLFRLVDDMKKTLKMTNHDIDAAGNAAQPITNRFSATVNNPALSGAASRHGGLGQSKSPVVPIKTREAAPVILMAYRNAYSRVGEEIDVLAPVLERQ